MELDDEHFMKKLKAMFQVEAHEQLQKISDGLLKIENSSFKEVPQELIDSIFREAHNLKGSARAVNHTVIQNICQSLESSLSEFKNNKIEPTKDYFNTIYSALDLIDKYISFEGDVVEPEDDNTIQVIVQQLNSYTKKEHVNETSKIENLESTQQKTIPTQTKNPLPTESDTEIIRTSIRVSTSKLDTLLQMIEETLMVKLSSKQRAEELKHLLNEFSEQTKSNLILQKKIYQLNTMLHASESKKNILIDISMIKDIIELTTSLIDRYKIDLEIFSKLSTRAAQDNHVSESIIDSLFENTKKVLMHPFGSILESFPRMVRDIAKSLNKNIIFNIEGKNIEIDKRILEEIKDPLMHLVRNAIDHGIETPEQRAVLKKVEQATITISAVQTSGNYVEISISDDGAGIDIEKLKTNILKKNKSLRNELEQIDEKNINMHLFQPGISTKDTVTEISGRGVGLGVVRQQVEKLKGSIDIQSKLHKGTTFIIKLPLTLATFRGLHINVGEQDFIIPSHNIRKVLMVSQDSLHTIEGKETFLFSDMHIPYYNLQTILEITNHNSCKKDKSFYIVVLEATGIKVALGVDQIFNEQEIFVKPLGKELAQIQYIYAATIMEWGKVIPILDPFDLVKSADSKNKYPHSETNDTRKKQSS